GFVLVPLRARGGGAGAPAGAGGPPPAATGRALVTSWGFQHPTEVRHTALTCTGRNPAVCVPPEYAPYAEQLRRDALAPVKKLADAGLTAPDELRIASEKAPLTPGTWPLHWAPPPLHGGQDPAQYPADLAESAVTGTAARAGVNDCRRPGSPAAAWAALVVGVDERTVRAAVSDAEWTALGKIRRLPAAEQAAWFIRAAERQEHCDGAAS
ncbi:hypothetical protein ACFXP3_37070, partial [Streptomyces sp. NPDC059096]